MGQLSPYLERHPAVPLASWDTVAALSVPMYHGTGIRIELGCLRSPVFMNTICKVALGMFKFPCFQKACELQFIRCTQCALRSREGRLSANTRQYNWKRRNNIILFSMRLIASCTQTHTIVQRGFAVVVLSGEQHFECISFGESGSLLFPLNSDMVVVFIDLGLGYPCTTSDILPAMQIFTQV